MVKVQNILNSIKSIFSNPELSEKWMARYATPSDFQAFTARTRELAVLPIFHETNLERAQLIIRSRKIYGIDVVNSAHFHHNPPGASRQAAASGVLLGFVWQGVVKKVNLSNNASSHRDRRPNILFDVPITEYSDETWELRLYPGTKNLSLEYLQLRDKGYLLREPTSLEVIHGN